MKELRLKIKRENYNLFKELSDKQAGELIKGMCAYMYDCKPFFTKDAYLKGAFLKGAFMGIKKEIDEAKQNSLNGKKSAEAYAERQRRKQTMGEIGAIIGGILSVTEAMDKDTNDGK